MHTPTLTATPLTAVSVCYKSRVGGAGGTAVWVCVFDWEQSRSTARQPHMSPRIPWRPGLPPLVARPASASPGGPAHIPWRPGPHPHPHPLAARPASPGGPARIMRTLSRPPAHFPRHSGAYDPGVHGQQGEGFYTAPADCTACTAPADCKRAPRVERAPLTHFTHPSRTRLPETEVTPASLGRKLGGPS